MKTNRSLIGLLLILSLATYECCVAKMQKIHQDESTKVLQKQEAAHQEQGDRYTLIQELVARQEREDRFQELVAEARVPRWQIPLTHIALLSAAFTVAVWRLKFIDDNISSWAMGKIYTLGNNIGLILDYLSTKHAQIKR